MNLLPNTTNCLVYDFGSHNVKFGYAGDAQPLYSVASAAARFTEKVEQITKFGDFYLEKPTPKLEVLKLIEDDGSLCPKDTDLLSQFFEWSYETCLAIEPQQHPIMVTQPTYLAKQRPQFDRWRKEFAEVLFEFGEHPAMSFEYDATLASISHSTHTALVVDFGWSCFRVVPVLDGNPMIDAITVCNYGGGSSLTDTIDKEILHQNKFVKTRVEMASESMGFKYDIAESQLRYGRRAILNEIIKSNLNFSHPTKSIDYPSVLLTLSTNEVVDINQLLLRYGNTLLPTMPQMTPSHPAIHDFVSKSIGLTPADVRRIFWSKIVCSGGLSRLPGFNETLHRFLGTRVPKGYTVDIIPPAHRITSGSFAVWAGGSILGSMDSYLDNCIKIEEWKETGPNILKTKCLSSFDTKAAN